MASRGEVPPPLRGSLRCDRCSLAGICMPDEITALQESQAERDEELEVDKVGQRRPAGGQEEKIRRLLPERDDTIPLFVVGQGHIIRKRGERLEVWSHDQGKVSEARIMAISKVCLYGGAEITTPAMMELMQRNVPVLHFSHGGWYYGICQGMSHKNVELRIRQFDWARDPERSLELARSMVAGKIRDCRTMLRRNDPAAPLECLICWSGWPGRRRASRACRACLESKEPLRRPTLAASTACSRATATFPSRIGTSARHATR